MSRRHVGIYLGDLLLLHIIQGRAIFGSGSPYDPVKYNDKLFVPAQANNAYIFLASESLPEQVTPEHFDNGLIYPPFSSIRKISANIAARVATKAYDLGDLVKYVRAACTALFTVLSDQAIVLSWIVFVMCPTSFTAAYAAL